MTENAQDNKEIVDLVAAIRLNDVINKYKPHLWNALRDFLLDKLKEHSGSEDAAQLELNSKEVEYVMSEVKNGRTDLIKGCSAEDFLSSSMSLTTKFRHINRNKAFRGAYASARSIAVRALKHGLLEEGMGKTEAEKAIKKLKNSSKKKTSNMSLTDILKNNIATKKELEELRRYADALFAYTGYHDTFTLHEIRKQLHELKLENFQ